MTKVKVRWQASDGYVGMNRPQVTTIDASEFEGLSRRTGAKIQSLNTLSKEEREKAKEWKLARVR